MPFVRWGFVVMDWASCIPHPLPGMRASRERHLALIAADGRWTYGALALAVARRAAGLVEAGCVPGQRIAVPMSRRGDDVITLHAVGWLGAVAVPMALDQPDPSSWCDALGVDHLLDQVADGSLEHAPPPRPWPLDELRFVMATSGTTGSAKTVGLTTGQLLFSAFGSAMRLGHLPSDRWLNPLPLHHVGGLSVLMRCLLGGSTVDLHPRFDAEAAATALCGGEVTQVSFVPMMLDAVLNALDGRPVAPQLRLILVGGAKPSEREVADRPLREGGLDLLASTRRSSGPPTRRRGDCRPSRGPRRTRGRPATRSSPAGASRRCGP